MKSISVEKILCIAKRCGFDKFSNNQIKKLLFKKLKFTKIISKQNLQIFFED